MALNPFLDFIVLRSQLSRVGTNILLYISNIVYAHKNNLVIKYDRSKLDYSNSIYVNLLFNYIDEYNKKLLHNNCISDKDAGIDTELYSGDLMISLSYTTINIKSDIISYFKKYIYTDIKPELLQITTSNKYTVPFDINKTIVVHIRLDDVTYINDYDGKIPTEYFKNKINNDITCGCWEPNMAELSGQAPIAINRIKEQIDKALLKYPDYKVVIIASPEPKNYVISLPYTCIRSDNPELDLFLLCNAKVIIVSRSTFSIIPCFLGIVEDVYCPLYSINLSLGLYTKYDNSNYNYFY